MKKPKFTREEENWICFALDDWYLTYKGVIQYSPGDFGYVKEILKLRLCDYPERKNNE